MQNDRLNDWLQIVGMAAIVASLIFVGLQLKQSQDIAIAAQYQARSDSLREQFSAILESEPGLRVIGTDFLADIQSRQELPAEFKTWASEQPVEELAFRAIGAYISLKSYDNLYFQYQSGFLSEEAWDAMRVQLTQSLREPQTWMRGTFEENPEIWRQSYRKLIQELLDESQLVKQ
jgi:hypothetical protein